MNITSKKSKPVSRKKIVIIIVIIAAVLLVAGGLAFAYKANIWPFHSNTNQGINYSPATKEQSTATGSTKQSGSSEITGSDPSPAPTPSKTAGQKPSVSMTITAANQTGGTLYIRTLIETIASDGTCTITMTGPGTTYTASSTAQAGPSTTTCQGFNVPVSSLATGKWHTVITYNDSSVQASASKDITVQ